MATLSVKAKAKPIKTDKLLGINTSIGETEIEIGEAIYMRNFRITKNYKAQKRPGKTELIDFGNTKPSYGVWTGSIVGKEVLITTNNGKVMEYNFSTELTTELGAITEASTTIIYFGGKLYFFNGTDLKEYDGTTYQNVDAYVPTITKATPPSGGGTQFEEINLVTGAKWQEFVGDGTSTEYTLAEQGIDADLLVVTIDGVTKIETTDFTVNRTTGKVTFGVAPINESDVRIKYVKFSASNKALVSGHKYAIKFGPSNDTNLFIYGNTSEKNVYRVSGINKPNYWPANSFYAVSDNEYPITALKAQYDRLLIFKQDRTHYSFAELNPLYDSNPGLNKYIFTSYDLNETVGNECFDGVQLIENDPVSFKSKSVWRWTNTSIEDERNASIISDRIKELLLEEDLSTAITFDYQRQKELWINIGDLVYIYNYGNDTWYVYDNFECTWFKEYNNSLYLAENGKIKVLEGLSDEGFAINSILKTGFIDFNAYEFLKNAQYMWLSIQPESRTSVTIKAPTNRKNEDDPTVKSYTRGYQLFDFETIDFEDFSFETNRNPQTFRIKLKAKKFAFIQFIFSNNEIDETLVIIGFKVLPISTGYSK